MFTNYYKNEDRLKVSNNLEVLNDALINIINGAQTGNFELITQAQIQIEMTKRILKILHNKKVKHDKFNRVNNEIYFRNGWIKEKEDEQLKLYYFTFGLGHEFEGFSQPIYAKNKQAAVRKMQQMFGYRWAFGYESREFKNHNKRTLAAVYARGD